MGRRISSATTPKDSNLQPSDEEEVQPWRRPHKTLVFLHCDVYISQKMARFTPRLLTGNRPRRENKDCHSHIGPVHDAMRKWPYGIPRQQVAPTRSEDPIFRRGPAVMVGSFLASSSVPPYDGSASVRACLAHVPLRNPSGRTRDRRFSGKPIAAVIGGSKAWKRRCVVRRELPAGSLSVVLAIACLAAQTERGGAEAPEPFSPATFAKHVAYLASDDLAGRSPGSEGSVKAADYIVRHFIQYGLEKLPGQDSWFQEFSLAISKDQTVTARNVLALRPGRGELKDEAIIVCAHYDHLGVDPNKPAREDAIYNGADDNASGVAALLMLAAALPQEPAAESQRSVVLVCFDAEERGLKGSRYYVERPRWPLDRTAAVINFDSIGRLRLGKVYASDAETSPVLAEASRKAAQAVRLIAETRFGGHHRSDHSVFIDRGIPSVHYFTGASSTYHQVNDELDTLNCQGGATIARMASLVLQEVREWPNGIEFRELSPRFDVSLVINLVRAFGIIPNMGTQEGRYPHILWVIPESPAAKYGMKSGDRITAINGLEFERVEDALFIFQQLTFEDGLRLSILRGDEKLDVHLPASVFDSVTGPKGIRQPNGKYRVTFEYKPEKVFQEVYLAGEFNDWKPKAHRMDGPDENGLFTTQLELAEGVYQYKFVIEGEHWEPDPKNIYRVGKYNNSVLSLGDASKD